MDGLYVPAARGEGSVFVPVPAPTIEELQDIVERIQHRAVCLLWRRGLIDDEEYERDAVTDETPTSLDRIQAASVQGYPPPLKLRGTRRSLGGGGPGVRGADELLGLQQ